MSHKLPGNPKFLCCDGLLKRNYLVLTKSSGGTTGGMGAFAPSKYFLVLLPPLPQNSFKCVKISPNLTFSV